MRKSNLQRIKLNQHSTGSFFLCIALLFLLLVSIIIHVSIQLKMLVVSVSTMLQINFLGKGYCCYILGPKNRSKLKFVKTMGVEMIFRVRFVSSGSYHWTC